ncbi:hypothetical protein V5799_034273 [Amblyomma americanum]|uniref:Uncharacterized protein n=1 Tax=Amblyomma americanum TaxID=6943 RepID=A0AAQ4DKX8_AMBAM
MNSRTLVGLMLVGLLGLASADHHEHHGSVCEPSLALCWSACSAWPLRTITSTTAPSAVRTSAMEADAQVALVGCIQEHLDEATATKLNTVKERLECDQLLCVFQKMCERNQGTLEHSGNEFFTDAEKEGFRNAISACRETVHHA